MYGAKHLLVLGALLVGGLCACRLASSSSALVGSRVQQGRIAPAESLELRVWRAGRTIPAGLSATRAAELEAARAQAAGQLGRTLVPGDLERLAGWLEGETTPLERWGAAARCVVVLEAFELAPLVARALEPGAPAGRAAFSRSALHALFGRWFQGSAEVAPFLEAVGPGAGTRLLVEAMLVEEARSRARLFTELDLRPASAAAWLSDPDPEVRSGAARILARSLARDEAEPGALMGLIAHLEVEEDSRAFHEALLACVVPLERMDIDHPTSLRLRALLVDLARGGGVAKALSLAQVLAHVSWRAEGARDLGHVLTAIDALGSMSRSLAVADRQRGVNDPDLLVAVLASLRQLCTVAHVAGLGGDLRTGATSEGLLELLLDERRETSIRAAAAAALGLQARAEDAPSLAAVLSNPESPADVKYALLGALGEILSEFGADPRQGARLAQAVATQAGAADVDLRRRALALLAEERLEPLVRGLDPAFLVERLTAETNREALLGVLGLIRRFGRPEQLPLLLESLSRTDLLGDPGVLEALVPALVGLARLSEHGLADLAERLSTAGTEVTRLTCLRHALALMAEVSEAQAFALTPEQNRLVCAWVWSALRAGVGPRELSASGSAFLRRVLEVHLPRSSSAANAVLPNPLGPFEALHLVAVLRADLCLASASGGAYSKPSVEAAFQEALDLSPSSEERWPVLRDRARFRAAANEGVKALADYRRLVEAGPAADLLSIPDLRMAFALLDRLDMTVGDGRTATAGESCALLTRIVQRPEWQGEPSAVRLKDLQDWVGAALSEAQPDCLLRIEGALAGLPQTQGIVSSGAEPTPVWLGLTREAEWLRLLWDLRNRVRAKLDETTRG